MSADSKEQLHGTITARAELDRAFARLIIEDVTSVMSKNISTVLRMMEAQHGEALEAIGGASLEIKKLSNAIGSLASRLSALENRMDESQEDRQGIHDEISAFRAEFSDYMAGSKRDEFARRLAALEARNNG